MKKLLKEVSRENLANASFFIKHGEYSAAILLAKETESTLFMQAVKNKIKRSIINL